MCLDPSISQLDSPSFSTALTVAPAACPSLVISQLGSAELGDSLSPKRSQKYYPSLEGWLVLTEVYENVMITWKTSLDYPWQMSRLTWRLAEINVYIQLVSTAYEVLEGFLIDEVRPFHWGQLVKCEVLFWIVKFRR